MKVSELMKKLQETLEATGDVEVRYYNPIEGEGEFNSVYMDIMEEDGTPYLVLDGASN